MPTPQMILPHLKNLFEEIRRAVTTPPDQADKQLGRNAKGDSVKWFDLAADQAVVNYLEKRFPVAVRLLSEEGAPRQLGTGTPAFTMVLDPVDGSENFARGIYPSGTAIALIPTDMPLNINSVQYGFVGNLYTGDTWLAQQGAGAFFNGQAIQPARYSRISDVLLSVDTNRAVLPPVAAHLLSQALGVRSFAAAAVVLAMVGEGRLGAHLDLTGNLTPENFLAPALVITESGGMITGPDGTPLPDIQSLTECFRIVAAATPSLHAALIENLAKS